MTITVERTGFVHVVDLGDGDNRFNRTTVDAINAALDDIEAVDGPAALVTTGTGKCYSNGLDLDWLGTGEVDANAFLQDVHALLFRVLRLNVTTVAAINGHAFAAGAMLAAAHDFSVMRDDRGWWCLPEADLGLALTPEMFEVIASRLPKPALAEAVITGRRYTAPEALAAGIITAVAPAEEVLAAAVDIATANAAKDRKVLAVHKALLYPTRS